MQTTAQRLTRIYLYLMLTVFPLRCGFGGYRSIVDAKYPLFLLLCGLYAVVMALLTLRTPPTPAALWRGASWTQRLIAVYLLFTWLSALLSPHFPETLVGVSRHEGALTITLYCLCFLFVSVYGRAERGMLCALGVTVLVFCAVCVLQLFGYNPLSLYPAGTTYFDADAAYPGTYLGTIGNVDLAAAFLCLVIPLFWVTLLSSRDRRRWWLLLPLCAALFVLLRMWVLAGIVGVFGGALLALPMLCSDWRLRRHTAIVLGIGFVAALFVLRRFDFGGTLHELHELLRGNFDGSFGSGRIHIWRSVLREIPSHLWLGTGPDTMLRASLPPFERFDAARGVTVVAQIDVAHNEFLNILFHQGIFALLAYLGALLSAAARCLRCSHGKIVAALGTAVLCWCVQAMFGFSMFLTTPLFFLSLALLERELRE